MAFLRSKSSIVTDKYFSILGLSLKMVLYLATMFSLQLTNRSFLSLL